MTNLRTEPHTADELRYDGVHCNLVLHRAAAGVLVLRIEGTDTGEFGFAPMRALDEWLEASGPVELFIDAREVRGASIHVSGEWAHWLAGRRAQLRTITMLTGSRFIEVTAEFVRRFADLQGVMRICTEPAVFDSALAVACRPVTP